MGVEATATVEAIPEAATEGAMAVMETLKMERCKISEELEVHAPRD